MDSNACLEAVEVEFLCFGGHFVRELYGIGEHLLCDIVAKHCGRLAEGFNGLEADDGLGRMKIPSAEDIGLCEEEARAAIVVPQMFDISSAKNWLKELLEKLPGKMEGKKEDAE